MIRGEYSDSREPAIPLTIPGGAVEITSLSFA